MNNEHYVSFFLNARLSVGRGQLQCWMGEIFSQQYIVVTEIMQGPIKFAHAMEQCNPHN